jgi:hypothetical protein
MPEVVDQLGGKNEISKPDEVISPLEREDYHNLLGSFMTWLREGLGGEYHFIAHSSTALELLLPYQAAREEGYPVPHDIDLITDDRGMDALLRMLHDYQKNLLETENKEAEDKPDDRLHVELVGHEADEVTPLSTHGRSFRNYVLRISKKTQSGLIEVTVDIWTGLGEGKFAMEEGKDQTSSLLPDINYRQNVISRHFSYHDGQLVKTVDVQCLDPDGIISFYNFVRRLPTNIKDRSETIARAGEMKQVRVQPETERVREVKRQIKTALRGQPEPQI